MIKYKKLFLLFFTLMVTGLSVYSQNQSAGIGNIIASIDTFSSRMPAEKIYLHFDKPYYTTGDTIWFKAYLFDATFLTASQKSGLVYLELANDTNKVLLRRMLPVTSGLGRGNIVLNREDIPAGSYTIRAYTNLMRNFGEDYIFKKSFYVSGITGQNWLVSSNTKISKEGGKENLRLGLNFQNLEKKAIGLRELQVRVMEGKKVLFRDKVQTDVDGMLDVNFNLPEKADPKSISIVAEDAAALTPHKITIPVPVSRPENIDLQFMPEGGNLVNGVVSRIGFKAIGEDGKGVDIEGKVYINGSSGSSSQEISVFSSLHKGMGSFYLLPQAGETYTATIVLPDSTTKTFPLPPAKNTGTTLTIRNAKESDSLEVVITVPATPSPATATFLSDYYLIGQHGSVVCYGATIRGNNRIKVAKKLFPTGISHFTLLSEERKPLNERMVYIDHHDNLNISITPDKISYKSRDSVALNIEVKDKDGKPVQGSFSVAVTDDNQVKSDSTNNIQTGMLLTSDLKGTVEDPDYYFNKPGEAWEALDNLLLTQGWVGYDWGKTFDPKILANYPTEQELTVKGKVINVLNKALDGTKVMMISTKPLFFRDTITDKEGRFVFKNFPQIDSAAFRIQANNRRDKSFNVEIEAEEFKAPAFTPDEYQTMPWYMNTDTTLLNYVKSIITQKNEEQGITGKNVLETVTITARKIVKGSKNLNGEGNADMVLDEKDMMKAGNKNLLQLLQEKISRFSEIYATRNTPVTIHYHEFETVDIPYRPTPHKYYTINNFKLNIIIDGVSLDNYYSPIYLGGELRYNDYFEYITEYLKYFTAGDVKGIELMKPGKYTTMYHRDFKPPIISTGGSIQRIGGFTSTANAGIPISSGPNNEPWIEITTRSGQGPFSMPTPGTYLFKPMPFAGTKQFYSPKYNVKDKPVTLSDLRSTIHWQPDVITGPDGKAVVSFYSADRPGAYTIIAEGSDMKGNVGSSRSSLVTGTK